MAEVLTHEGVLEDIKTAYDVKGNPFLELTIDGKPFRYFKGDPGHKEETMKGLLPFKGRQIKLTFTEKYITNRQWPYRNIMAFLTDFSPASALGGGSRTGGGPVGVSGAEQRGKPPPPADEMIISELEQDPEVLLMRRCIKLSLLTWHPQFQEWKNEGLTLTGDFMMRRIGETATSFYISKKQERR